MLLAEESVEARPPHRFANRPHEPCEMQLNVFLHQPLRDGKEGVGGGRVEAVDAASVHDDVPDGTPLVGAFLQDKGVQVLGIGERKSCVHAQHHDVFEPQGLLEPVEVAEEARARHVAQLRHVGPADAEQNGDYRRPNAEQNAFLDADEERTRGRKERNVAVDGYIALFTATCTLLIGIQEGILLGIGASVIAVLFRISRPNMAELGHVPGTRLFRDLDRFEQALRLENIMVLRVDAAFSFANAEYLHTFILEKSAHEGRPVGHVVMDGSSINSLDATATDALFSVAERLVEEDIELHLAGLVGPVRETVRRAGLHALLGEEHFHLTPYHAVASILERADAEDGTNRLAEYLDKTGPEERAPTPKAT